MAVTLRCKSGDGDTVMVCEDIDDGSPSLLFYRKTGLACWLMLDDDQARQIGNELLRIANMAKPS